MSSNMHAITAKASRGIGMVELMIALALGSLITLAVTSVFMNQREAYRLNESASRMQENARFALEVITQDLRHTSFLGRIPEIDSTVPSTTLVDGSANSCAGGIYTFDNPDNRLLYANNMAALPGTGTELGDCASNADSTIQTSVLTVKRAESVVTTPADVDAAGDGVVYIFADGATARLFDTVAEKDAIPNLADGEIWRYAPKVYYIDDDNTLQQKRLTAANGTLTSTPVAEGIEAFHIEFGIDNSTPPDGIPDFFYSPTAGNASDNTIDQAVTATVYILARTLNEDRNHNDDKSYRLGTVNAVNFPAFNDGFRRRVYSMTTELKNLRGQLMMKQGI